ncbi:hypothetical protein [Streptomyces sp. NBC_00151]|uniref:hypothetical protein n=1 Tax=Streptomyces sp. NBC_00151 TaxID=2975669 RepID=UPI002DDBF3CE|nr:hypothetical protein [Streptomyces sp. NBC_00151]WRZ44536.1 hypothetical protein OG915_44945 [Streptomyces sp. NBC_00151]
MSMHHPGAPAPQPAFSAGRCARAPLGAAQVAGLAVFPVMATVLALAGMPVDDTLWLLAGSGVTGASCMTAAGVGRPLLAALASAAAHVAGAAARQQAEDMER